MDSYEKLKEEYRKLWTEDGAEFTEEDLEQAVSAELGEKKIKRYEKSAENKPKAEKKPKIVKVSDEKVQIFNDILANLQEKYNIDVINQNKLIEITLNGKKFKLDLIESRK